MPGTRLACTLHAQAREGCASVLLRAASPELRATTPRQATIPQRSGTRVLQQSFPLTYGYGTGFRFCDTGSGIGPISENARIEPVAGGNAAARPKFGSLS